MNVVAIYNLTGNKEILAGTLAALLGVMVYEARVRLLAPGDGPLAVAVFSERERAVQLLERLQEAGFKASMLTESEIENEGHALIVKRFNLDERELGITTITGGCLNIPYRDVELILRGTAIVRETTTETVKSRSLSPGRAVLSGGLIIAKATRTLQEVTTEERQDFVNLYSGDRPTIVFRRDGLLYDSLGPALRPSRAANFTYLVAELRRRCPAALYDERLLNRAAQAALLGSSLDPEKHLVVATALLAKVLRNRST